MNILCTILLFFYKNKVVLPEILTSSAMTTAIARMELVILNLMPIFFLFFSSTYAQSKVYIVYMDHSVMPKAFSTHHNWFKSTLSSISENSELPISSKLIHTYTNSIHGFSASLTPSELASLKNSPGYIHSTPDRPLELHTTHSTKFLGMSTTSGVWPASSYGEGVIIGVIDSGIWPESESFKDRGMSRVPLRWKGKCETEQHFNSSLCNKKLIGARFFNKGIVANFPEINITLNSARDDQGHGSHTASTAAGNFVENASYYGYAAGTARGMAPRARVAAYKVLWKNKVFASDVVAAVDQAIKDGVDVLSMSLGFFAAKDKFYEEDAIAVATFAAMEKGIFVSASAGNAGRLHGTINNGAPWLTTVGAGTVDREFEGALTLGNDTKQITFESLYAGNFSGLREPLVFLNKCKSLKKLKNIKGKVIVVCKDGKTTTLEDQIEVIKNGSTSVISGAIFVTNDEWKDYYDYSFAATFVDEKDNQKTVMDYISKNKNPTGILEFRKTILGRATAPKVARYSSRGPFMRSPSVLKPDILAPGSEILASWSPLNKIVEVHSKPLFSHFKIISGTSMAAPHVSGLAALIKTVHPDWSPAAIRSAIMTTANPLDNTGSPIKDAGNFDHPASPLEMGTGFIDPNKAIDPGLIYDAETEDYVKLLCSLNYTAKQMKIITKTNTSCNGIKPSSDLNYPSFIAYFPSDFEAPHPGPKVVREFQRRVRNVGKERSSYIAELSGMRGLKVKVEPMKLVFRRKNEMLSYKLSVEGPTNLEEEVVHGSLSWVEESGKHVVRSPIVATNMDPMNL
ncbi:subtilisin-like protease SBT1.9 [Cannabis sativa]|uniref:subtilisin-like protease SBT1.9 n=1 Tax=Cannabis sativa TaxID=3483 RepID=UPI0029CA3495|nr:subtilisin-like protease SBT1.9 [Cannabis sativa]